MDIFEYCEFLNDRFGSFYLNVESEAERKFGDRLNHLEKEILQLADKCFAKSQVVKNFKKSVDEKIKELGFKQYDLYIEEIDQCIVDEEYKSLRVYLVISNEVGLFVTFAKDEESHCITFGDFVEEINDKNQQIVLKEVKPSHEYSVFLEQKDLIEKIVRFIDKELFQ